jgi:lipopolysaccharide/colanic/teichoic acid biosynthesis glycosyltransferase
MTQKLSKRIFDIVLSAIALLVVTPFLVLIGVAIRLNSRAPILFANERSGINGTLFKLIKFRTMIAEAKRHGPSVTAAEDPRITPIGAFLRRTKIDELPTLWNVLKGDMSLVGPRPETPEIAAQYTETQRRVLSVRPGITSMATVKYIREEDMLAGAPDLDAAYFRILQDKLKLDLDYIDHQSLGLDVRILFQTVVAMFR